MQTQKHNTLDSDQFQFKKHSLLTHAEEIALAEIIKNSENGQIRERARQKMMNCNLKLVLFVAKQHQNQGLELPDLISEGTIGLSRAVDKFDPTKGFKFSTYAYHWIRQAITRAIQNKNSTIRIPVHLGKLYSKIQKFQREYHQKNGNYPTVDAIADHLKITPEKIRKVLGQKHKILSLNRHIKENENGEIIELIKGTDDTAQEYALHLERRELLEKLLETTLTPIQQDIIKMLFGWDDKPMNCAEIARQLNVPDHRVRTLANKAITQLRSLQLTEIKEYLW